MPHNYIVNSELFVSEVKSAISVLPPKIRKALDDTAIVIDDEPFVRRGKREGFLLGLYEGVPLTEWGRKYSGKLPDKITIFKNAIEKYAGSEEEVPRVIRETVWHEIGHYFGLNHSQIGKMEERWRGKIL